MENLTDVKCSECDYIGLGKSYDDCPKCEEGILQDVVLLCSCGKGYSIEDIERAVDNYHYEKAHSDGEQSEDPLEEFSLDEFIPLVKEETDSNALAFVNSSLQEWCGGSESYNWTEYYRCPCGEQLEMDNGW